MTSRVDQELILYMDPCTGKIDIEGITCDSEHIRCRDRQYREFRTGLAYETGVTTGIRSALKKRGVKVNGVPEKCLNISKDWLVQILTILYYGLTDKKSTDRLTYLINAANSNSEWKNNPGFELQQIKEKEYWDKVEQFDHAKRVKTTSAQQNQSKNKSTRILIVEDDLASSKIMSFYLSPLGECDHVDNGSDAIKAFTAAIDKGESYDLIVLDIMLPEINGHEVLKRIRSIEEKRGVTSAKIIMTTALNDARVIMSAFNEQCDGYLVKPIRKSTLMKRLCELNLLDH